MKLLRNLFLALVTSLTGLGASPPAKAHPHAVAQTHTSYWVYWRYSADTPWVMLPYTFASYAEAYNWTVYLANNNGVETYIMWRTQ